MQNSGETSRTAQGHARTIARWCLKLACSINKGSGTQGATETHTITYKYPERICKTDWGNLKNRTRTRKNHSAVHDPGSTGRDAVHAVRPVHAGQPVHRFVRFTRFTRFTRCGQSGSSGSCGSSGSYGSRGSCALSGSVQAVRFVDAVRAVPVQAGSVRAIPVRFACTL